MLPGTSTDAEDPARHGLAKLVASLLRDPGEEDDTAWGPRVAREVRTLRGVSAAQVIRLGARQPVLGADGGPIDPSTATILCGDAFLPPEPGAIATHDAAPGIHAIRIAPREAVLVRLTEPDPARIRAIADAIPAPCVAAHRIDELRAVERRLNAHREIERSIAQMLSGVKDIDALGLAVNRTASILFDFEQAGIYFREPTSSELRLVGASGMEDWEREEAERTAWDRHPGRVLRTGRMVVVDDVRKDPRSGTDYSARRIEIRSRCFLPVNSGGEVVGTLGIASTQAAAFGEEHIQGLQFLANLAGLTWSRLLEEKRRERRDRVLIAAGDAAEMLLAARRWRDVIPQLTEMVGTAMDAHSVRFLEGGGRAIGGHPDDVWIPDAFIDAVHDAPEGGLTGPGGHPIPGFAVELPPIPAPFVAVPVAADGQRVGVLIAIDEGEGRVHDANSIAALRAFVDPLASKVARDRLEDSIRQGDRMDALGQLAGGVAHDLNNLLMPILGQASTLATTESDPTRRDRLEAIQFAAERGRDFVEQVLLLTRRRVATDERTVLADVIAEAIRLATADADDTITIEASFDDREAVVVGDRTAILRMIQNLVTNARQAIGDDGGTIRIGLSPSSDAASDTVLTVADDGCGIPDDVRRRLFEPFFTTRRSSSERGLGLTIVHRVVTELGGSIEVASRVGRGTTFTITLPREDHRLTEMDGAPAEDAPPSAAAASNSSPASTTGWILVVDDDAMVRSTTTALLESLDHVVRDAAGGREALDLIAAGADDPPALVLTDLSMPEMDGLELVSELRRRGYQGPTAVITGYGEDAFDTAREAGVNLLLRKPISRQELGEAIAGLLS